MTRPLVCRYGCPGPARLYMGGRLCTDHAPPPQPSPPPGSTLAERRGLTGTAPSHTVLDDRAITTGKRRSTPTTYRAARTAEETRHAR